MFGQYNVPAQAAVGYHVRFVDFALREREQAGKGLH